MLRLGAQQRRWRRSGVRITSSPSTPGSGRSSTSPSSSTENSTPGTGRPIEDHSSGSRISARRQERRRRGRLRLTPALDHGVGVLADGLERGQGGGLTSEHQARQATSRAVDGSSGEALSRRSMVGTANIQVMPRSAIRPQHLVGVEAFHDDVGPAAQQRGQDAPSAGVDERRHLQGARRLRAGPLVLMTQVLPRIAARAPRWEIAMPLGCPVEPELNRMW